MIYDFAVIGAGIAGASVASHLAPHASVLILEGEDQPGYHSTGRSNALFHESYGGPQVSPLTTASSAFFVEGQYVKPRQVITLAKAEDAAALDALAGHYADQFPMRRVERAELDAALPGLLPEWHCGALENECYDIDVAAYHGACLSRAKSSGAVLQARSLVVSISREAGVWTIKTRHSEFQAAFIVNAAGGWADSLADMAGVTPLGVQPYRRTIVQAKLRHSVDPELPFIIDVHGTVYFRPEGADRVWISPHDEHATPACDVAPEELDIAIAVDRFQQVVNWPIEKVEHSWAGLRSFAPDRLPIYGFDPDQPGFFWCAGQGGFGIQTAPATSALCASALLNIQGAQELAGINFAAFDPKRFRK